MIQHRFFITGHKGFETLLFRELRALFDDETVSLEKRYGGVEIESSLAAAYRICLHSRLANRVFLELSSFRAANETELYQGVAEIDWTRHLGVEQTLAAAATVSRSSLDHSRFVALKVKDAIVDQFRNSCGQRPSVARERPDLQLHIHIHRNQAQLSLDLSGESLHRRGYRQDHTGAPLKEHLAAAMLLQAGWLGNGSQPVRLLDPMCGSGTFAIEAAMIANNLAPGLRRDYFGFKGWRGHQAELWQSCINAAESAVTRSEAIGIFASDYDAVAVKVARQNAQRAGVEAFIEFSHQQVNECRLPEIDRQTLIVTNPPYGKRLQAEQGLEQLYTDLGACVRRHHPARLAIVSANPECMHRLELTRSNRKAIKNGPLDCIVALYDTASNQAEIKSSSMSAADAAEGLPLRNRLLKNSRHLQRWARRNEVFCYRLYDADLPEFAFALDRYQSAIDPETEWFHLQEYQAPASIHPEKVARRIEVARSTVLSLFEIPPERLFCKLRARQRGRSQYQAQAQQRELFQVREGDARLLVNLSDYIDTGLFLDHRITRQRIHHLAHGKTLLNLFCYTGSVSVQAGLGGAKSVLNVDMSSNYLRWAAENHALNQLDDEGRFRFLPADVMQMLEQPAEYDLNETYDLIFLDPPSFSNSSKMSRTLDIQRDHTNLIGAAMRLLKADGLLIFSCNRRGFKLAESVTELFQADDVTGATIPEDFRRKPSIHHCWEIRHRN